MFSYARDLDVAFCQARRVDFSVGGYVVHLFGVVVTKYQKYGAKATVIQVVYIAYHIWLIRNAMIFDSRYPVKVILERPYTHAKEILIVTSTTMETWGPHLSYGVT